VLVSGGGIGGLAIGHALARLGFSVRILEQAEDFREVGAGVQVAPNGVRALRRLGLGDEINKYAWKPTALVMKDAIHGSDVIRIPLGQEFLARFNTPYYVIHRADLLEVLLQACRTHPNVVLETGSRVEKVEISDAGANVVLADGRAYSADALVGADGLRSPVRQFIVGDGAPPPPRYVVYRGVIPRAALPDELWSPEVVMWSGPDADFVHYPLRSGELFNLVATFKAKRNLDAQRTQGDRVEMVEPYAGHRPEIQRLLELLNSERRWMVTDREPVRDWCKGSAVLIGDAAHPMLQYMAQGACQALEDSVELATCVMEWPSDLPGAFRTFRDRRYLRTARVQFSARQMIEMCQATGTLAELRSSYFRRRSPAQFYDSLAWLYSDSPSEKFA
jgi:salicylate hydroxylase